MGLFNWNPSDVLEKAIEWCDRWFLPLDGTQGDEIIRLPLGKVEFVLWGSYKARNQEYWRRHNELWPGGYSLCWATGDTFEDYRAEVWASFKRLKNGRIVFSPWCLLHETWHAIDWAMRLKGFEPNDPDNLVESETYK